MLSVAPRVHPPELPSAAQLAATLGPITPLAALIVGLVNCFLGYRLFKLMLAVYGLLVGAGLGIAVADLAGLTGTPALVLMLIPAAAGAWLTVRFYFFGIFLVGAVAGALAVEAGATMLALQPPAPAHLVMAVIVGALALHLQRVVIILSTAFSGAWMTLAAASALVQGRAIRLVEWGEYVPLWPDLGAATSAVAVVVLWLVLGTVGSLVQLHVTGAKR